MDTVEKKLNEIIERYNSIVQGIDKKASDSQDRAYGGVIRSGKGGLVEDMAAQLVRIAWTDVLGQDPGRMEINKKKFKIGISDSYGYIDRLSDTRVKDYVTKNRGRLVYKFGTDVQVFVDKKLVLPIECKTYTENAMIKRIIFDAHLMKEAVGAEKYYLVQLESQLGGDYGELNEITYGSAPTHALLSHMDVNLEIITLLKGERKVDRPIHKPEYFKELKMSELRKAVNLFAADLKKYANP